MPLGGRGVTEDRDNCCVSGIGRKLNEPPQAAFDFLKEQKLRGSLLGRRGQRNKSESECCAGGGVRPVSSSTVLLVC